MEFYDVGSSDLKELWESYLSEPGLGQDVLMATKDEEWSNVLCLRDKSSLGVVLRDRLMTDAALGGPRPIKSEHSYSLLASSPPASPATPGDDPHTPKNSVSSATSVTSTVANSISSIDSSMDHNKSLESRSRYDDIEEECFLTIPMNTASNRCTSSPLRVPLNPSTAVLMKQQNDTDDDACAQIKGEPISAPNSPHAPNATSANIHDKNAITVVSPKNLHFVTNHVSTASDSDEDDEDYYQAMEVEDYGVPCEDYEANSHTSRQNLPPTPPSSASSDSECTVSASCSPERRDSQNSSHVQNIKGLLTPRLYVTNSSTTRQPIHTPLISCQPKGSTGVLTLTEEEKRTLIAEGYPVPTKLPLTKQEEKSLKKIRRKIKNKISAQESRRKKKEYMDGLERRVTMLTNENSSYRDRLTALEDTNRELLKELQRLQALLHLQTS